MRSGIRFRITAIAMTVVTVVLLLAAVALLVSQRQILTHNIDEILATNSRNIEHAHTTGDLDNPIVHQGDEDAIAQVVDNDGQVLASTSNFATQPALTAPEPNETTYRTLRLPIDESKYRLMSRSVDGVVIHTAAPIDDVEEGVAALRTGLLIAIPAIAVIMGLLIWWLVGRTLRPVEEIRTQVAAISGTQLDRRVPEPTTNDEIARLARTMNAMLDRVEDASQRQRRFVADASHELRSPLARMQTELEVDLAHPQTADLVATHRSALEEVSAMHRLVEDLLHLARSDNHTRQLNHQLVDIDDLVLAAARQSRASNAVQIDTTGVTAAQVFGDRDELARAIRNVCDNAARHANSRITLTSRQQHGVAQVTVTDDGPGIPEHERWRVFERFARVDEARQTTSGGTGLGLAITLDIIQRHGGTITIEEPEGGGARFVLSLPTAGHHRTTT
jgi:signal transduction histidine kinase